MTKRTVEEIRKEIKETYEEAFYYYKISRGVAYAIRDWEAAKEASRLFRRITNLKRELDRAKIRDWGLRAKEPRRVVE
jgi:ribosomal protein L5